MSSLPGCLSVLAGLDLGVSPLYTSSLLVLNLRVSGAGLQASSFGFSKAFPMSGAHTVGASQMSCTGRNTPSRSPWQPRLPAQSSLAQPCFTWSRGTRAPLCAAVAQNNSDILGLGMGAGVLTDGAQTKPSLRGIEGDRWGDSALIWELSNIKETGCPGELGSV